tara:strand:- start:7791 stop:8798 length:1008 start_codon:yes stop_codon:yes gene_type:complete
MARSLGADFKEYLRIAVSSYLKDLTGMIGSLLKPYGLTNLQTRDIFFSGSLIGFQVSVKDLSGSTLTQKFLMDFSEFDIHTWIEVLVDALRSRKKIGQKGFEPMTSRLSGARSNQLSYSPTKKEKEAMNRLRIIASLAKEAARHQYEAEPDVVWPDMERDGWELEPERRDRHGYVDTVSYNSDSGYAFVTFDGSKMFGSNGKGLWTAHNIQGMGRGRWQSMSDIPGILSKAKRAIGQQSSNVEALVESMSDSSWNVEYDEHMDYAIATYLRSRSESLTVTFTEVSMALQGRAQHAYAEAPSYEEDESPETWETSYKGRDGMDRVMAQAIRWFRNQ